MVFHRLAFTATILALVLGALPASAAMTADQTGAVAKVQQFFDLFNSGGSNAAMTTCAPGAPVIDDFPPHQWSSCAGWARAYAGMAKTSKLTGAHVTLVKPVPATIDGSIAYVVGTATYTGSMNGKPFTQPGVFTAVLHKSGGSWAITAWTWADR